MPEPESACPECGSETQHFEVCPECEGSGLWDPSDNIPCDACNGAGGSWVCCPDALTGAMDTYADSVRLASVGQS